MEIPSIVAVTETSQVAEARRAAASLARRQNWDESSEGKLSIAVTEAATNLVKHGRDGEIHIQLLREGEDPGIELLALDRGPGMSHVDECLADGYSTQGTAGGGLGAIRRMADAFDLYSQPGKGTVLMARFYRQKTGPGQLRTAPRAIIGAVQVPIRGETVSGDNWGSREQDGRTIILVADGLGHGPEAAEASQEAVAVLSRTDQTAPAAVLERVHHALRATRGAAVAVASIDPAVGQVRFAGVGNISAMILTADRVQNLVSYNGTAGHSVRKIQEFTYPWTSNEVLLMHSDGLTTSWRLDAYPGILQHHPTLLAALLYRDANRGRDDALAVVARVR
jgi:anti-sigma regulatory factor (Ser/Thr protein kinase)/serine/threonine protein phosphatase PrpC